MRGIEIRRFFNVQAVWYASCSLNSRGIVSLRIGLPGFLSSQNAVTLASQICKASCLCFAAVALLYFFRCDDNHILRQRQKLFSGRLKHSTRRFLALDPKVIFYGDYDVELAHKVRLTATKGYEQSHDLAIIAGYSILAIQLLAAICFASAGPGADPADFFNMSAFP